jgi:tetratricopeptide (TPR) repeat protein
VVFIKIRNKRDRIKSVFQLASIFFALLIAACQPAPEERYAHAEKYFDESDYRAATLELKNALQANPDFADARMLLAKVSYQLGDFATAEFEFERAISLGKDIPENWVGLGRSLALQGKAREALERVLPNLKNKDESGFVLEGDILSTLGNTSGAETAYLAALEKNPDSPGGMIGRAGIVAAGGDIAGAREILDAAVLRNSDSPIVWRAKGNFLLAEGEYAAAAAALATAKSL